SRRRGAHLHCVVHRFLDRALPAEPARTGEPGNAFPATGGGGLAVRVLIVSGIWPPDVGGPASHAPEVAEFLRSRGHEVEVVTTAPAAPAPEAYPVHWISRAQSVFLRYVRGALLVGRTARGADVVYSTGMYGRTRVGSPLARA